MPSSARLPKAKILATCECGKKYRVPAAKAGKKITCKACGDAVRIPRPTAVSDRSRGNILAELGIDPIAAQEAYKAEAKRRAKQKKSYRCTRCEGDIASDDLKGAYVAGELVCSGCRATAEIVDRRAEQDKEVAKGNGRAACELASSTGDPARAAVAAAGYGAMFFVGTSGPLWVVMGLSAVASLGAGVVVAGLGAAIVYRHKR